MTIGQRLVDFGQPRLPARKPTYTPSGADEFVPPEQLEAEQVVRTSVWDPQGPGPMATPLPENDWPAAVDSDLDAVPATAETTGEPPGKSRFAPEMRAAIAASVVSTTASDLAAEVTAEQTFRDADGTLCATTPDEDVVELPEAVQDAYADPQTCDVCTAANLSEDGVMPTSATPEQLHSRCRYPGTCSCGCEYSRGGRCQNCGRNRIADDLFDGTCVDRTSCAETMLNRPVATPVKKATTKSAPRPPSTPRAPRVAADAPFCSDGCGERTGGGTYKPGHDSRHVKTLVAGVRAGGVTLEAALAQLPSEALRAKLSKQLAPKEGEQK